MQNVILKKNMGINTRIMARRKKRSVGFNNLPMNVLLKIFQYFTEEELQKNIIPVCQKWKYAGQHPSLWKKLVIRGKDIPTAHICFKLRCFSKLETIHLENVLEPVEIIRQIARCNPNLKNLILQNCTGITERSLLHLIKSCKDIESVDLEGTQFKGNHFYTELSGLKKLRALNFSENKEFTITNLLTVVLNCRGLEELQITKIKATESATELNDHDISFIIANMSSDLKSLVLDSSNLTSSTFETIFRCKELEKLHLYGAGNLPGELFKNIWKFLPNLKELVVRHAHHIDGEHIEKLFTEGQNVMKNLEVLDFTGCWKVNDSAIEKIADCCPNLKHVTLKSCKSLTTILPLLQKCTNMQHLNVAFCNKVNFKNMHPLPSHLKTLITHKNNTFMELFEHIKNAVQKTVVYICLSEYNNRMICYK